MKAKWMLPATIALSMLAACGSDDGGIESPDGENEVAFADGKADSLFGDCERDALLNVLNSETTGIETLKDAGVHTRAAKNLIKARNGDDGAAGTADDFAFANLKDVDDVSYVGKVAMNQLATMVAELCVVPVSQAEVIFSPQPYDQSHLARVTGLIEGAEESIDIAMYSYSDGKIGDALEDAVKRGVSVRMIFESANSDKSNPAGTKSSRLEDIGVDVRYVNKIMHHKYVLIDGPRSLDASGSSTDKGVLASGSGNWSNSAGTRYDENTLFFFGNTELNMRYQAEFNRLWGHSRDFSWNSNLEFFESDTIDQSMIVDDPSVDAVFTSDNFRMWVSSRFGNTFSAIRGMDTVADRIVQMIEESEESIWIASGHLRSRPVSEALLKKHAENPDMDIRVYLDGQEYISESTHNRQEDDLEVCLGKAGTSEAKIGDCMDKGFYFSFPLHEAGIDLKFKHYAYRWHYSYAPQMHHKYLIFDGRKVMTGSYNLSDNAEHNTMENMTIFTDEGHPDLVDSYIENFETMWVTGDDEELFAQTMDEVENGTSSRIPIVYDSMALSWDRVNELKSALNSNCTDINTTSFRRTPERHFTCTRR